MAGIRAVLFDFNGVLWWDSDLQEAAWKQYAASVRGAPFSDEELTAYVYGRTNRDTLEYLLGEPLDGGRLERLSEEKETIYRAMCLAQGAAFRLSPGAAELLDFLAAAGIPRTIATSSPHSNIAFFIRHLALERWFNPAQIICDDGRFPGKPAPDIYLRAAETLGVPPERCLVVEDSTAGVAAARAAGVGLIAALGSPNRHEAPAGLPGVGLVIERLDQLPRHLFLTGPERIA
jgi:HAD superfamily hydrolase (TIGR01509 family)